MAKNRSPSPHGPDADTASSSQPRRWRLSTKILVGSIGLLIAYGAVVLVAAVVWQIIGHPLSAEDLVQPIAWWLRLFVLSTYVNGFIIADRLGSSIGTRFRYGQNLFVAVAIMGVSGTAFVGLLMIARQFQVFSLFSEGLIVLWWGWFLTQYVNTLFRDDRRK